MGTGEVPPRQMVINPEKFTRHLLYFIYPIAGNGIWQWNLDQLTKRISLFNGRRICAIATDTANPIKYKPIPGMFPPDMNRVPCYTESPEKVIEKLKEYDIEYFVVKNDPNLREVAAFFPLFSRLANLRGEGDVTLFAQAKGVTRTPSHPAIPWTDLLYQTMLDYWGVVERSLRVLPVTGSFLKVGQGWPTSATISTFHYSGSWFWFRNAVLFSRDWMRIDKFWSGIEPYPSQHFSLMEAGTVFHEGNVGSLNMYSDSYIQKIVLPEYEVWKRMNEKYKTCYENEDMRDWDPVI